ncbi:M28 family peptidase [Flavobacterium gawalongense]|uniref:M20/M25/M40 family metallo-hydrolase n=1 Tax=Flavobacterium gawalongense TaxID=2594432 RepID=A0A553BYJ2_9FLAO|nr:M20/M25/M40 family metallo-hydrolase [Flavobacterium gawalongense]TRX01125.1 M20/M25/M40 family metallo-hydrolase [Flavobacterium gawalongense]TRX05638.1 M20/M25/M40 family metallo-hydrolase [Flavobacterium gawalongense]TRX13299.1 M20/M25/M40 family metallo-hydrolase [Flavobacterium gawalongense]TRX15769.1 M20/M25/M40 family metallo-hydrolase [Flavobacterium gawalongense]TRX31607.1 M20/M25/M40 family metallo-hydrolase [Flavobacterium gawalongense]
MKNTLLLLPFVLFGCLSTSSITAQATNDTRLKLLEAEYKVKENDVAETLKYLTSDELEGRETGTKGMVKAADYLEQFFKNNDVKPYFKSYRDTLSTFKETAFNIVGFVEGTDAVLKNEFIILSAHYDHIGIDKKGVNGDFINNGANDDASGTTAVAEMAKYFSAVKNNKRSVLFVFFTGEEKGLLGSKHLAKKLKAQNFNLYAQFNIEMIGVPMKRDYLAYITGFDKSNMASKINEYTGKNTIGFLPKEAEYQLFYRSDNYSFYNEFHVPCQSVSTFDFENFEFYHHVSDEFKAMDLSHMTSFIQELLPAVTQMTNAPTHEIHMN